MFSILRTTWEIAATQSLMGSISWQHEDRNMNNGNAVAPLDVNSVSPCYKPEPDML